MTVRVTAIVLAGGRGERLRPLTNRRAKPAVPFGGGLRLIDFTLLNCAASELGSVHAVVQADHRSVSRHVETRWSRVRRNEVHVVPPPSERCEAPYLGTADALRRNLRLVDDERPEVVLVLSGDHVYCTDYRPMITRHLESGAPATALIGCVPANEASEFGVLSLAPGDRVASFVEKPTDPTPWADGGRCTVNFGVYCFDPAALRSELARATSDCGQDLSRSVLPEMARAGRLHGFRLARERGYWRDIGNVDAYFAASMDLLGVEPRFSFDDPNWQAAPFRDWFPERRAARARIGGHRFAGTNLIAPTAVVESEDVVDSIVFPGAFVAAGSELDRCVVLPDAHVGPSCVMRRTIVEEGAFVAPGTRTVSSGTGWLSRGGVAVLAGARRARLARRRTASAGGGTHVADSTA